MVLTDSTFGYFQKLQHRVRASLAELSSGVPFAYSEEPFFELYDVLRQIWRGRKSKRSISNEKKIGRGNLKKIEDNFISYGTVGLLPELSLIRVDPLLEKLVVLVKSSRPHEHASHALRLANALGIPGASLELIREIQRCHGYGQFMDDGDIEYFQGLQHLLLSVEKHKTKEKRFHDHTDKAGTFHNFTADSHQHRLELFRTLSACSGRRQIRPILRQFGIHQNRFYFLKNRYMTYGVWGLVNLSQVTKGGEKISPDLELRIIERKLVNPSLSATKMIKILDLKCSRANVQKIYSKWRLSNIKEPVSIRGVISRATPDKTSDDLRVDMMSMRTRLPNLIENANLKINASFSRLLCHLAKKTVTVSNPGAIIAAPFLDQLGSVEALHTLGPESIRSSEITNNIIVNVLRIIAGFPTINDFTLNSDRSVAIGAGLTRSPRKSRFYDSFDELRFNHLQKLRNDASRRARELGVVEGKEIAIDYHCDPSDSRFPKDKTLTKAPDKNGDMVYAHRPQILWDAVNNSIINIAYCSGDSRGPSALYKFCEDNLFKVIDPDVVEEIYADSEYTGEKQIVYLTIKSESDVTMCLKQNPKIKRWREETVKNGEWREYGAKYKIACKDFKLSETGKPFRFIVKQDVETGETRCFGSTHVDRSPHKILDSYHVRWPVETGIKDLGENYFLNRPPGTSPEKAETHYYCVMLARLTIDYFLSVVNESKWQTPEEWGCVLSTIRTTVFSNQSCQLSLDDSGDLLLTYLDGDPLGIKKNLSNILNKRKKLSLNKVSWWGGRGVQIQIKNQFDFS
jgi:hypothetical protein